MRKFNKLLAGTAAVAALTAAVGAAFAQTNVDPQDTPTANTDMTNGAHIYKFKNEGTSPETDPAAHLILLKPAEPMAPPVAQAPVEQAPVVAQADTSTQSMPAASDTTTTDTTTDSTPVPADTAPTPAPKADRN